MLIIYLLEIIFYDQIVRYDAVSLYSKGFAEIQKMSVYLQKIIAVKII